MAGLALILVLIFQTADGVRVQRIEEDRKTAMCIELYSTALKRSKICECPSVSAGMHSTQVNPEVPRQRVAVSHLLRLFTTPRLRISWAHRGSCF